MRSLILKQNKKDSCYSYLKKMLTGNLVSDYQNCISLVDIEEPKIEDKKYVKIKTIMCGICGTDLGKILNI